MNISLVVLLLTARWLWLWFVRFMFAEGRYNLTWFMALLRHYLVFAFSVAVVRFLLKSGFRGKTGFGALYKTKTSLVLLVTLVVRTISSF